MRGFEDDVELRREDRGVSGTSSLSTRAMSGQEGGDMEGTEGTACQWAGGEVMTGIPQSGLFLFGSGPRVRNSAITERTSSALLYRFCEYSELGVDDKGAVGREGEGGEGRGGEGGNEIRNGKNWNVDDGTKRKKTAKGGSRLCRWPFSSRSLSPPPPKGKKINNQRKKGSVRSSAREKVWEDGPEGKGRVPPPKQLACKDLEGRQKQQRRRVR